MKTKYKYLVADVLFEKIKIADTKKSEKLYLNIDNFINDEVKNSFNLNSCKILVFGSIYDIISKDPKPINFNGSLYFSSNFSNNPKFNVLAKFPKIKEIFVEDTKLYENFSKKYGAKVNVILKNEF